VYWRRATTQGALLRRGAGHRRVDAVRRHADGLGRGISPQQLAGVLAAVAGMVFGSLVPQWLADHKGHARHYEGGESELSEPAFSAARWPALAWSAVAASLDTNFIMKSFALFRSRLSFMPIYAYKCGSCGFAKDVLQKMSDTPLSGVPVLRRGRVRRSRLTAAGFQLKGSGWYVTDFRDGGARVAPRTAKRPVGRRRRRPRPQGPARGTGACRQPRAGAVSARCRRAAAASSTA
jgi:putative FmdB family regulatory protein